MTNGEWYDKYWQGGNADKFCCPTCGLVDKFPVDCHQSFCDIQFWKWRDLEYDKKTKYPKVVTVDTGVTHKEELMSKIDTEKHFLYNLLSTTSTCDICAYSDDNCFEDDIKKCSQGVDKWLKTTIKKLVWSNRIVEASDVE